MDPRRHRERRSQRASDDLVEGVADVDAEGLAESFDEPDGAAPALTAEPVPALLSAVVTSMGNLIGLPPADMSTLPSALRVSGFSAKSERAYLGRTSA